MLSAVRVRRIEIVTWLLDGARQVGRKQQVRGNGCAVGVGFGGQPRIHRRQRQVGGNGFAGRIGRRYRKIDFFAVFIACFCGRERNADLLVFIDERQPFANGFPHFVEQRQLGNTFSKPGPRQLHDRRFFGHRHLSHLHRHTPRMSHERHRWGRRSGGRRSGGPVANRSVVPQIHPDIIFIGQIINLHHHALRLYGGHRIRSQGAVVEPHKSGVRLSGFGFNAKIAHPVVHTEKPGSRVFSGIQHKARHVYGPARRVDGLKCHAAIQPLNQLTAFGQKLHVGLARGRFLRYAGWYRALRTQYRQRFGEEVGLRLIAHEVSVGPKLIRTGGDRIGQH